MQAVAEVPQHSDQELEQAQELPEQADAELAAAEDKAAAAAVAGAVPHKALDLQWAPVPTELWAPAQAAGAAGHWAALQGRAGLHGLLDRQCSSQNPSLPQ